VAATLPAQKDHMGRNGRFEPQTSPHQAAETSCKRGIYRARLAMSIVWLYAPQLLPVRAANLLHGLGYVEETKIYFDFRLKVGSLTTDKPKRRPRVPSVPPRTGTWRDKVHPFFIKSAEMSKRIVILARSDSLADRQEIARLNKDVMPEIMREAELLYDEQQAAGRIRHLGFLKALGIDQLPPGTELPDGEFIYRFLCWFRFGKNAEQLTALYEAGDLKAVKQMHKLRLEYDMWKLGKVDPNKLKFKTDLDHFVLLNGGLDLGLEDLNPDQLAECFDELCPCGRVHEPENLKKLRRRIVKMFPPKP